MSEHCNANTCGGRSRSLVSGSTGSSTLFIVALMVVTATQPTVAQEDASFALPIREHVFDNGLRLLVLERPGDHRVAAKIFTDFGALVEEPGELGAAHFLEHLMFKGTPSLGTTDWAAEKPLMEAIANTERALIATRNLERNTIRERGVFHDYAHARTTPKIDSLQEEINRLDRDVARYRRHGAMMRWYQAYGGQKLTATTEQEYMKFDINLPADRVELFFRVEADRMVNSVFREFDAERMILIEQRLGDLNRPTTPFYELMNATVGMVHPVFWPEGYATDFQQYTREYERELYEKYFVPNNTTIVLIGGVSFEQMVPLVDRHFGWMSRAPEPTRVRAVEPSPKAERRVLYRSDDLPPRIDIRHMIPAIGHPDRAGIDVLAGLLSLELKAAFQAVRISAQVDVNTRVVHERRFGVPSSVNIEVVIEDESQLGTAESTVLTIVDRISRGGVSTVRLELAKKKLRNEWFRTVLDADRLAFEIGHFQVMDTWRHLAEFLTQREVTNGEDVARLAGRYLIAENRTVGVVTRPVGGAREVSGGLLDER